MSWRSNPVRKLKGVLQSFADPRTYLQALRLAHFAYYSHVQQIRKLRLGSNVQMAPNVSFRNAERVTIGDGSHVGEYSVIWAGNSRGVITLGRKCLLAPHVTITAS